MRLTRDKILQALLLSLNDSKYLSYFPVHSMHHYSKLGYTAVTSMDSQIRILLEVQASALHDQLGDYIEPRKRKLSQKQLLKEKTIAELKAKEALKQDKQRFDDLEKSWKEDEPRARQEILDNAEKAAQNIYNKNQELKKTKA